jgi:hypothetical protein
MPKRDEVDRLLCLEVVGRLESEVGWEGDSAETIAAAWRRRRRQSFMVDVAHFLGVGVGAPIFGLAPLSLSPKSKSEHKLYVVRYQKYNTPPSFTAVHITL